MLLVVSFIWNICQLWGCWKVVVDSFFRVNVFWTVPHSFGIGAGIYRRYFYLIAFRSYLISRVSLQGSSSAGDSAFSAWMQARPELGHLCDNLKLKWIFFFLEFISSSPLAEEIIHAQFSRCACWTLLRTRHSLLLKKIGSHVLSGAFVLPTIQGMQCYLRVKCRGCKENRRPFLVSVDN